MTTKIPILQELQRLKVAHDTAKVRSEVFQPNEDDQRKLIIKSASAKIITNSIRKESVRFLFDEHLRMKDEQRRAKEMSAKGGSSEQSGTNGDDPLEADIKNKPGTKGNTGNKAKNASKFASRAQTAPANKSSSNPSGSSRGVNFAVPAARPQTSYISADGSSSDRLEYATLLKSTVVNEEFRLEMSHQVGLQAKDVQKAFNDICHNFKGGVCCQFNPKSDTQQIDVSLIEQMENARNAPALGGTSRLEDFSSKKKRGGMALFIDPVVNTDAVKVMIRIEYVKMINLIEGEDCSKDVTIWSDGNYYGARLISGAGGGGGGGGGDHSLSGSRHGEQSPPTSRALTRSNTADTTFSFPDAASYGPGGLNGGLSGIVRSGLDEPRMSVPGWNHRPPIYIPSNKCTVHVIKDPQVVAECATTAFNISRLRIFAVQCWGARQAVRKLHDYTNSFYLSYTANIPVTGGMAALNVAALHGNLEGVRELLANGAKINERCKGAKYHTPLHEAVIGGHVDIVEFLLANGANQLVRDELGFSPLHHACKLENICIARVLIEGPSGKRALLLENSNDQKPIEVCSSSFMKSRIEGAMRKFKVFAPPRVSILDRK